MSDGSPTPKRRVPLELEPLGDLDKGGMSEGVWRELNSIIEYEAKSVQATGVIVPSPARGARSLNRSSVSPNHPGSETAANAVAASAASTGATRFPARFPAMESFFYALATLGVTKQSYRGLALLHNSANLGVWQSSNVGGANSALRAQMQARVDAQAEAIDQSLREASERARVLREEQTRELAAQKPPGEKPDQYLKDLQSSRIEAEFERMRDQLRAEDAARREQLEYSRELRQKEQREKELADKKQRLQAEREQRAREREERLRELQQAESKALDEFETKLREHGKVGISPKKNTAAPAAAAAAAAAASPAKPAVPAAKPAAPAAAPVAPAVAGEEEEL